MPDFVIDALYKMPLWEAAAWIMAENFLIFILVLAGGQIIVTLSKSRPVSRPAVRTNNLEIWLAVSTVILNAAVTFAGLLLWRSGWITLRTSTGWRDWLDLPILFFVMDFMMYVLHRTAHLPWLYSLFHKTHHRFEDVRPLTLFALNPLENLSFGLLWLLVLVVYQASWLGITLYLALNVLFGLTGHLGVEPFPSWWSKAPGLGQLSSSTFHAQHHRDGHHNFGFYTLIWDRLFKTLSPRYSAEFGQLPAQPDLENAVPASLR